MRRWSIRRLPESSTVRSPRSSLCYSGHTKLCVPGWPIWPREEVDMRCPMQTPDGSELLLRYSAGRSDMRESAALAQHIRECSACERLIGRQQTVAEALELWEAPPV